MKEKIKKMLKNRIFIFILGGLFFSSISVYAVTYFPSDQVTYDNKTSNLKATQVQAAIDELYNVCFQPKTGGEWVLDNTDLVTSGDGLYKDEYEDGRYFYKGSNPNNYVTFNNEVSGWRIISIEKDGSIKIMRNNSIGNQTWNSSNSNNWARPASLNTYLNSTYYSKLNLVARNQIVAKDFSIGAVNYNDTNLANIINSENSEKWNGKVALVTTSEYIRSNSNQSSCGNMNQLWYSTSCGNTTWMDNSTDWWMLTPYFGSSNYIFIVHSDSNFDGYYTDNYNAVRPVLYLSTEVQITGGDGSQSNPYILS